jgi:hypothetical protein
MSDAAPPTPRELAEATYHRANQRWAASKGVTFREAFVVEIEAAIIAAPGYPPLPTSAATATGAGEPRVSRAR